MTITYTYFGFDPRNRYSAEIDETDAYLTIGANALAGFDPVLYTCDSAGWWPMTTPDGEEMRVVALTGTSGVIAVLAFVGRAG
ncbi:hypothetical protein [Streptomyces sp. NPDC004266]|uniref:hypothetical protein n=1 Tax=Streptomyces sp. NPDC004266 TaxID=3364693 RepID=UPI003692CC37